MDYNDYPDNGIPYAGLPLSGTLWQTPDGQPVIKGYNGMTETEKEHLIMSCKDAKNLVQKQKTMEELAPDMDFRALAAETGMFSEYTDGMQ